VPPARRSKPRSPEHAALGEAVRTLRLEAGMSQEELADAADTDLTQVGGVERGVRNPSYTTLLRLATALETTVGELTTLADKLRERD
jgi:transcriptional regulator with XRE-family HTH domain